MHARTTLGDDAPDAIARAARSLSEMPSESTAGCCSRSECVKPKKLSGACVATHAAALAARSEYFVPFDFDVSMATGWYESVAAPSVTHEESCGAFASWKSREPGAR